ncbi:MAG: hypothetical protein ACR2GI_02585 [Thermomicrobiales bacterium]
MTDARFESGLENITTNVDAVTAVDLFPCAPLWQSAVGNRLVYFPR